jgi:hypothetical protein
MKSNSAQVKRMIRATLKGWNLPEIRQPGKSSRLLMDDFKLIAKPPGSRSVISEGLYQDGTTSEEP